MSLEEASFAERLLALPYLGLGISTEFGAAETGLDPLQLRRLHPELVQFLEVGCDLERGFDESARRWVATGGATTYHFLDLNLEESEDLEPEWVGETKALATSLGAAWVCGDAGLWHIGPRERGHTLLAAPILEECSARTIGRNVARARQALGLEVLPENPPAYLYLGRMHLAEYLSLVAETGDTGILLDLAHYAIYLRHSGRAVFDGFERLPFQRIVEVHLAGGTGFHWQGRTFVDDDHGLDFLPELWELFEALLERAPHLRAVVLECERNPLRAVVPCFERIATSLRAAQQHGRRIETAPPAPKPAAIADFKLQALQRTLFRMQADGNFAARMLAQEPAAVQESDLGLDELALLVKEASTYSADRDFRRREQLLGNVRSEFHLSQFWCECTGQPAAIFEDFLTSQPFHQAIRHAGRLPFAYADYLEARARELGDRHLCALLRLERAMAQARRVDTRPLLPPRGKLVLSPLHSLVNLPLGTLAMAEGLKSSLDSHARPSALPAFPLAADNQECAWIAAAPRPSQYRLAAIEVQKLPDVPGLAEVLEFLRVARPEEELLRFGLGHGLHSEDMTAILSEGEREGIILRGP